MKEITFARFMRMQGLWFCIIAHGRQNVTAQFVLTNAPRFRSAIESRYTIRG